jgi:hypothetical protein
MVIWTEERCSRLQIGSSIAFANRSRTISSMPIFPR